MIDARHFARTVALCSAAYPAAVRDGRSEGDPHAVDAREIAAAGYDLRDAWHLPATDTEFYLAAGGNDLAAVVRGTTSLADWRQDAKFRRVYWQHPGRVHHGFFECYNQARDIIAGQMSHSPARVAAYYAGLVMGTARVASFYGHSLGGGIATLLAIDYAAAHAGERVELATIGAPRALDRVAAEYAESLPNLTVYRYYQATFDVITYLPYMGGAYRHLPGISLPGFGRHICASYARQAAKLLARG